MTNACADRNSDHATTSKNRRHWRSRDGDTLCDVILSDQWLLVASSRRIGRQIPFQQDIVACSMPFGFLWRPRFVVVSDVKVWIFALGEESIYLGKIKIRVHPGNNIERCTVE